MHNISISQLKVNPAKFIGLAYDYPLAVENRNKAIRRYVKKRTDLSTISKETFNFVEEKLRNKFMKCLNFKTPKEAFENELKKINNKKSAKCGIINNNILLDQSVRIEGFL